MTERVARFEKIIGVRLDHGEVVKLDVAMADGTRRTFVPEIRQPAPVVHEYIGKHEKLNGGYRYGRTGAQPCGNPDDFNR